MSSQCHNCEQLEGGSIVTISQPQQAYCEQCGSDANTCLEKIDTKCVYYHYNHPEYPTTLINLGIPSNTDLQTILEKINDLIGQNSNIDITAVDSDSIIITASGAVKHTLRADVVRSSDVGNILELRSSGVFVPNTSDGKVKVNGTDASDYLINQVVGGTDGIISIDAIDVSGLLTLNPSVNLGNLVDALLQNSAFNEGVSQTSLSVTDSSTIDFTASGIASHSLTGEVKVSATAGNAVTVNGDGLYVATPASSSPLTFSNGLTRTVDNTKLGGTIIEHTLLNGNAFDFSINPRRLIVGSEYASAHGLSTTGLAYNKVSYNDLTTLTNTGAVFYGASGKAVIPAGISLATNASLFGTVSTLYLQADSSFSAPNSVAVSGFYGLLSVDAAPGTTVTIGQAGSGRVAAGLSAHTSMQYRVGSTPGTFTHVAGLRIIAPYQAPVGGAAYTKFTNYYGIFIESSQDYLVTTSDITNKYGIYQAGTSDPNEFYGELRYHNGLVNASDKRVKDEISEYTTGLEAIKNVRPIVYKYKESYQKDSGTFVGIIAQEVENILPHSIRPGKNKEYEDFRYYDEKSLIYAMVNAIKELSQQVDELKAQLNK